MTPKSVAAAVDPSPLDAPIGIGIGIGIEPGVFDSVFPPRPFRAIRWVAVHPRTGLPNLERRRRRPPLHGLHGEFLQGQMGSPVAACAAGGSEPDLCVSRPSAALR